MARVEEREGQSVKKLLCSILIIVVILAISLPRIIGDGVNSLKTGEQKEEVKHYNKEIRHLLFGPLDMLMVQSYTALYAGDFSPSEQQSCYNYSITYYTFFGIPYQKVGANCEGYGH